MTRWRIPITILAFLATFGWLLVSDVKASPAVLWPSVLAVGLAFVTRDIYLSLFLGALSGALLLDGGNPWTAFRDLLIGHLISPLTDRWNINVLVFTLLMGGFVEVLNRNGGMAALSARVIGRSESSRRAALGAYLMGFVVFIDGLASSLLVGKTLRPIAERTRLSREKLAFIVDSTSAPIAGLALISTWVSYELSLIRQGLVNTGDFTLAERIAPFSWLVSSLPFRFYNWFMLLLVFLLIWLRRDWGSMLKAEKACRTKPPTARDSVPEPSSGSHIVLAVVPLAVLVLGVFSGLYMDGGGLGRPFTMTNLVEAIGKADAAAVFVLATAIATAVALGLGALGIGGWPSKGAQRGGSEAFFHGMQQMFLPTLILVFAWMLNSVLKDLGTAGYLVASLQGRLPASLLPALVFLLAAIISFSTGTSWGTMAITMPLVIPLAVRLTGFHAGMLPSQALMATVGAVLAGAVFGDHCSPISDTTIVSAFSSDCDVMAHVRTQLPYALASAILATLFGYGPAGFGWSPVWSLAIGGLACWALVRSVGKVAGY